MALKSARSKYEPDQFIEEGAYKLNANDPFDMDVRAAANELALRGDPSAAVQYLIFAKSMETQKPVVIPTITFAKKGSDDKEVSQNATTLIDALIKSGWKVS